MSDTIDSDNALDLLFSELENNLSDDSGIEGWEYDRNIDQEQLPFDDEITNETNEDVIRLKTEQRKIRDRLDSIQLLYESIKERSFYPRLQKLDILESEIKEIESHQVLLQQEKIRKDYEALLLVFQNRKVMEKKRIKDSFNKNSNFYDLEYQDAVSELKALRIQKLYARKSQYLNKIHRFKYPRKPWFITTGKKELANTNGKVQDKQSKELNLEDDLHHTTNGHSQ